MEPNKLFISENIIVDNKFLNGGILVNNAGKITKVLRHHEIAPYKKCQNVELQIIDVGTHVIMPGIVDSHVHVNEPGRTDWEGYETATRAAAAGGVTTIVDMPLNSIPPTTTLHNFKQKLKAAQGKVYVDVAFWGGVIPGNQDDLMDLINAGVVGFKCFMCESGVEEFPCVNKEQIEVAMKILENTDSVLAFHAELDGNGSAASNDDSCQYSTFLRTRPASMEINAIKLIIELARNYNVRVHIVHLSTADALPIIAEAKKDGVKLTVETCHHYLSIKNEDIPEKATQFKCTPPIRDLTNLNLLWQAIKNGLLDMVVSDHSPCTSDLKCLESGNFMQAWGGISSLQFDLSLFWTQVKQHGLSIFDINKYMTYMPAKLVGLHNVKGQIATNYDADFVIWDPHSIIHVEPEMIQHKNKITPYLGKNLYGKVLKTVVRGHVVYDNEKFVNKPNGKLIQNVIKDEII
ncbi:uncharacterized protein LOC116159615 isoform X1 [Photinus pyralis]|nr:uncharacterized protein LOC116159549 isoform X1 [Photinus pyralis]XP_031328497.1 uncharacterized protein LOC116159615 isoform X1 [Photinus pyralis]